MVKIIVLSIVILILVGCSAIFSCADMCYSVVNPTRLQKASKKSKFAKMAYKFAVNYDETIASILFSNNLVNILATSLSAILAEELFTQYGFMGSTTMAETTMSVILLLLIITFGEVLPKVIGRIYNYRLCLVFSPLIKLITVIFFPFVWLTSGAARGMSKPFIRDVVDEVPSDEELQHMVDEIEEEGIIDEDASELISDAIEFKETAAYEIMTPRVRIEGVKDSASLAVWANKHSDWLTHSRLLVYHKNYDHIVGYIPTKTLLKSLIKNQDPTIESMMLPIVSVPRTMEISGVLRLMKRSHHHIAVVKDEYGGTEGIITLEDILEELVGELYDESEHSKEDIAKIDKNLYLVQGKMNIDDFFEYFNLDRDYIDEDYNTLSGWIVDRLGKFAKNGDKFTYGKIDLKVKKVSEYTVEEAEVSYHPRRKKIVVDD